ncbi:MAG: zf-TFIIB domain-containing protein [Candidatus Eremiobacteraeota bacterium]|nr:zf-TFIIB domain-containing protein [Candidatus Eremiobacteraeota bacterium]
MDCPVCILQMDKLKLFEVEIDTCRFCGGLWLDGNELSAFIQKGKIPKRLLTTYCLDDRKKMVKEGERKCPNCRKSLQIVRHRDVDVEYCNGCRGIWFDRGELLKIVKSYYDEIKKKGKSVRSRVNRQQQVDDDGQEMIRITDEGVFEYIESEKHGKEEEESEANGYPDESSIDPILQELMSAGSKEAIAEAIPKSAVQEKKFSLGSPTGRIPSTMGSPIMQDVSPMGFTRQRRREAGDLLFGTISAFIKSFFQAADMS